MATTNSILKETFEILERLPPGVYFDNEEDGSRQLEFQADNQEEVGRICSSFPGVIWKKEYRKDLNWWEYHAKFNGWKLKIYACREAPKSCTAIMEKRVVKERIPATYKEVEVEREFIVGWDCGKEGK